MVLISAFYKLFLRPFLFLLPTESAHKITNLVLRRHSLRNIISKPLSFTDDRLHVDWCGFSIQNPVGLAAGFDKDCEMIPSLASIGFGYITGGTVTADARYGNPKPRIVRDRSEQSLINAMGFPNKGVDAATISLSKIKGKLIKTPIVVSISGTEIIDILECRKLLEPLADVIEINISSPNTAGLKIFQEPTSLDELIGKINDVRRKPLMIKLPPYSSGCIEKARENILRLARICTLKGVDGLTIANSKPVIDARLATGRGGLSGKPILEDTIQMVKDIRSEVGSKTIINACGGVFTGEDAWRALQAGANTIQLYTGLIYNGPGVVKEINKGILKSIGK